MRRAPSLLVSALSGTVGFSVEASETAGEPEPVAPILLTVAGDDAPTYRGSIAALFARHCVECHREGGSAPFALTSYDDAASWSPQIREVVADRRMPPWHADPRFGRFANDRSLDRPTIDRICRWVDEGAREGDRSLPLPPRATLKDRSIDESPDLVLVTPAVRVPAEGTLPYEYVRVAPGLAKDRWVRAAEVRSTRPEVVHHVLVFLDEPFLRRPAGDGDSPRPWRPVFNQLELMQGAPPNEWPKWQLRFRELIRRDLRYGEAGGLNGYFLADLAGGGAVRFAPDEGKLLPASTDVIFQIHHQPVGAPVESSTALALWFADEAPARALDTRGISTVIFEIPPHAPEHEVRAEYRLPAAASLRSLQPHMHLRGKEFTYVASYPPAEAGAPRREETLLHVPSWDFDWQHEYVLAEPKRLPAGTILRAIARYDNSAGNPANPDADATVYFGLQTHEEMMIGYFEVVWDPSELDEGE